MSNEKDMMLGTCRFCGQRKMVDAPFQQSADEIATEECTCEEGKAFRKKEECLNRIMEICQAPRNETGVVPMSMDHAVFIKKAADLVAIGAFGGVTVDFLDTTIKLRPGTEDKPVKFSRSWKLEIEN